MIIELIGQPTVGKSYITANLTKAFEEKEYKAYSPEEEYLKLNTLQKLILLLAYLPAYIFNVKNWKALSLIKKKRPSVNTRFLYYFRRHLTATIMLKKAYKKEKDSIVIISEALINLSAYIFRENDITQEDLNVFSSLSIKYQHKIKTVYVKIDADKDLLMQSKIKRFKEENRELDLDWAKSDIQLNEQIFESILKLNPVSENLIRYKNTFTGEYEEIKLLSEEVILKSGI